MKNGGYSLVEVMVVVAILAIALTIVGLSISNVYAFDVRSCAKDITSELEKEKIACMTRAGNVFMHLYKGADGKIYVDKYEDGKLTEKGIKVGKATVTLRYFSTTNTDGSILDENGIYIAFKRDNGGFMSIGQAAQLKDSAANPPFAGDYFSGFELSSSGAVKKTIRLWSQTGKFTYTG